jgi:hypothetical protein
MSRRYFIRTIRGETGPYSTSELRILIAKGDLGPDDHISDNKQRWVSVRSVRNLQPNDSSPDTTKNLNSPLRRIDKRMIWVALWGITTAIAAAAGWLLGPQVVPRPPVQSQPNPLPIRTTTSTASQPKSPQPAQPLIVPTPGRIGDVEVSITKSQLNNMPVSSDGSLLAWGPFLEVEVTIVNRSTSKLIDFRWWSASELAESSERNRLGILHPYAFVRITDEFGNVYRTYADSDRIYGGADRGPAYPSKPLRQKLLLNPPVASAKQLDFEFSGAAFQQPVSVLLRLPLP